MTISIVDPGFNFVPLIIVGGILLILGLIIAAVNITTAVKSRGSYYTPFEPFWVAYAVIGIIALFIALGAGNALYREQTAELRVEALTDAGFSDVELDKDDQFTAATSDGDYFRGVLVELEDSTWQVLEVTER